jgi:hypothetical protein
VKGAVASGGLGLLLLATGGCASFETYKVGPPVPLEARARRLKEVSAPPAGCARIGILNGYSLTRGVVDEEAVQSAMNDLFNHAAAAGAQDIVVTNVYRDSRRAWVAGVGYRCAAPPAGS